MENLIKLLTCYKNADNPSYIDVLLTNRKNSFQNTMTIETRLRPQESPFSKLTVKRENLLKEHIDHTKDMIGLISEMF